MNQKTLPRLRKIGEGHQNHEDIGEKGIGVQQENGGKKADHHGQ